jgi:hypothetical protein
MREILYRGKRVDNGEWVYGLPYYRYDSFYGEYRLHIQRIKPKVDFEIDPETICQYIGRQVNGKKLFEGDIIKISGRTSCYAEVTYSEISTSYWVENKNLEYFAELSSIKSSFIEVVGNVIDNPGLLKNT